MFEYGFLNIVYVSDDCREIKDLPEKLQRLTMTSILTACPEYYENKWYPVQHMIQFGITSKRVSPTIDLNQVDNDYDPDFFEPKALTRKRAIGMKFLSESLERISKEKIWLHEATKEHIILSMSRKESVLARQAILKKKKAIYENLMESILSTHHEVCKVLKY